MYVNTYYSLLLSYSRGRSAIWNSALVLIYEQYTLKCGKRGCCLVCRLLCHLWAGTHLEVAAVPQAPVGHRGGKFFRVKSWLNRYFTWEWGQGWDVRKRWVPLSLLSSQCGWKCFLFPSQRLCCVPQCCYLSGGAPVTLLVLSCLALLPSLTHLGTPIRVGQWAAWLGSTQCGFFPPFLYIWKSAACLGGASLWIHVNMLCSSWDCC